MAYSTRIYDKAYTHLRIWLVGKRIGLFLLGTGLTAVVAVTADCSAEEIAAMTVLMAGVLFCCTRLWKLFDTTWEGTVMEKHGQYTRKVYMRLCVCGEVHPASAPAIRYTLLIQRDGRKKPCRFEYLEAEPDGVNNTAAYFRRGDRVRHHAFLPLVEKEDKSKDRWVLCLKCQKMAHKYNDVCHHCGMPVLK